MKQRLRVFWLQNKGFIILLLLMVGFRSAIADWNTVPTGSMQPTIVPGDRIWVNKLAYDIKLPFSDISLYHFDDPKRGDIIVFESDKAGMRLIKRVIGLPGDTIEMHNNRLTVNGETAHYEQLNAGLENANEVIGNLSHAVQFTPHHPSPLRNFAAVTVPQDHYLVLGDNRDNSLDSRYYGFIPRKDIIGRSRHVVLSLNYDHYYLPRKNRFFYKIN